MKRLLRAVAPAVIALSPLAHAGRGAAPQRAASDSGFNAAASNAKVVRVAPPTGVRDADRRSILSALEQSGPGDTIQFAAGTYSVGKLVRVPIPGLTILGHANGTTLRGCEKADFPSVLEVPVPVAAVPCNGLELTGGNQTVRNLTFEYTWHALILGCCNFERVLKPNRGGYLIEGNTFRESSNGIRVFGQWQQPAVIRNNTFINTFHAVVVNGMTAHVLDNRISVPEPERVPEGGHPGNALGIACFPLVPTCDRNVIAENQIDGHPDGILMMLFAGASARHNVIRENTIAVRRVRFAKGWAAVHVRTAADSFIVGVPLSLLGLTDDGGKTGIIEDNLIQGNRVTGGQGLGIEILRASRNRIVNNSITGVRPRNPFPGNTFGDTVEWREANGSGIWVSRGSDQNEIRGNTFTEIAGSAIVLEGKGNHVTTRSAADVVRDLGTGNRVPRPR